MVRVFEGCLQGIDSCLVLQIDQSQHKPRRGRNQGEMKAKGGWRGDGWHVSVTDSIISQKKEEGGEIPKLKE